MEFFGLDFVWWKGVCENRKDPLKLGRCKIRVFGWHTEDKQEMPTETLPWAYPSLPIDSGKNVIGIKEGDFCWGFFRDGKEAQEPVIVGYLPGIPEEQRDPSLGFSDPTPDSELSPELQPRPPEYTEPVVTEEGQEEEPTGQFSDPNVLPGSNIAFGELQSQYNPNNYKWDVNNDGTYNAVDANIIIGDASQDDGIATEDDAQAAEQEVLPMSRYPLTDTLKEPSSSRLARNENIEKTIVAKKRGSLTSAETASHAGIGVGSDVASETEPFDEPETPYDAQYPFNHVYESESGHVLEIDDTPGKERLHRYHRIGTFEEIHPDGTRVVKGVKKGYNIFLDDYYMASDKSMTATATDDIRVKAGSIINVESGADMNIDSGGNRSESVGADNNVRIKGNKYVIIEGDCRVLIKGDSYLAVEGNMETKVKGDYLLDVDGNVRISSGLLMQLISASQISLDAVSIATQAVATTINGPAGGPEMIVAYAQSAGSIAASPAPIVTIPTIPVSSENTADNKDNLETVSPPKEGFILYGTAGDLYKPISDSTGNAVTLSPSIGLPHILYQALPTGELQEVLIEYKHKDGTITSWTVIRPVHKLGKFIERGVYAGNGNGGRDHYRWSKPGKNYPKQMFLNIGDTNYLILDSGVRHESFGGQYMGY